MFVLYLDSIITLKKRMREKMGKGIKDIKEEVEIFC